MGWNAVNKVVINVVVDSDLSYTFHSAINNEVGKARAYAVGAANVE